MRWDERQLAMLREMGIRLWIPQDEPIQLAEGKPAPAAATVDRTPEVAALEPARSPARLGRPAVPAAQRDAGAAAAPSGDVAAMDWPALRAAVAACSACKLCSGRTQTVFGVGHERAHWMIVGEAPGEEEDRRGEPFVGKAGQLLDAMLRAIGLTRADAPPERQVYITNTLKCRPPGNRNPQPDELAQCEPFLARQIALAQPKIIVAMGRFAVQALLRSDEPVGRLRGRVHRYAGVPLVVTYHPAYLLRNPQDKARAWDDLCLALDVAADGVAGATAE
jgi:DNA polymerase